MDIKFVKQIPLFSHLSDEKVNLIMENFEIKSFKTDDLIIQQNDPGNGMYGIIFGSAEVIRNNEVIANLETNDFFGEMSLIVDEPRSATVRATSNLSVFFLSKESFNSIKDELGNDIRQIILNRAEEDYGKN